MVELIVAAVTVGSLVALLRGSNRAQPATPTPAPSRVEPMPDTIEAMEIRAQEQAEAPPCLEYTLLLHRLSNALLDSGRPLEAEPYAARLGEAVRAVPETSAGDLITVWRHHARVLLTLGRLPEAMAVQARVAELADRVHGAGSLDAIGLRVGHHLTALVATKAPEALQSLRDCLGRCEQIAGNDVADQRPQLSQILREVAECLFTQGEAVEAERALRTAHEVDRKRLGDESIDIASSFEALSVTASRLGQGARARELLERSLELREKNLGPLHRSVSGTARALAGLMRDQGRPSEAEALLKRSLVIEERHLGPSHPHLIPPLRELAELYRLHGRVEEAEAPLRRAVAIVEEIWGDDHGDLLGLLRELGRNLAMQSRYPEADALLQRAVAIARAKRGHSFALVETLDELAHLAQVQAQSERADALLVEAAKLREEFLGVDHPELAFRLLTIAGLRSTSGRHETAEPLLARGLRILEESHGHQSRSLIGPLFSFSWIQYQRGNLDGALAYLDRAASIANASLAETDPARTDLAEAKARVLERLGRSAEAEHERSQAMLLRQARSRSGRPN